MRLEQAGGSDPETVQVRFDYDGGANALGNAMPRHEGQRLVDLVRSAGHDVPPAVETPQTEPSKPASSERATAADVPLPLSSESAIALVIANIVDPLVGVLFFGWDNLGDIMVLYWVESGVVAPYTVLKIAIVGKFAAFVAAPFFVGHFGGSHDRPFPADKLWTLHSRQQRRVGSWARAGGELAAIFVPRYYLDGRLRRSSSATACRFSRTSFRTANMNAQLSAV